MTLDQILETARQAGLNAGANHNPTPVVFGTAKTILSNEIDYTQPTYYEEEGLCGFAWVKIRPARGKFVNYLKQLGIGRKSYEGGYDIRVSEFGQSYERKEAYARAFAKVLNDNGINAIPMSRLD